MVTRMHESEQQQNTKKPDRRRALLIMLLCVCALIMLTSLVSIFYSLHRFRALNAEEPVSVTADPYYIPTTEPPLPPTPEPKVEQIKILYMNTKDLTPENAWPTMRVGEAINVNAVVYPMDILNPVVEWSCSDTDGTSLQYTLNSDGTVTLTCVSAELRNVQLTASCYGTSVTITIYLREAA